MIRVTVEDLETGETETKVLANDYLLITTGSKYLDGVQTYPKAGTTVLVVKTEKNDAKRT